MGGVHRSSARRRRSAGHRRPTRPAWGRHPRGPRVVGASSPWASIPGTPPLWWVLGSGGERVVAPSERRRLSAGTGRCRSRRNSGSASAAFRASPAPGAITECRPPYPCWTIGGCFGNPPVPLRAKTGIAVANYTVGDIFSLALYGGHLAHPITSRQSTEPGCRQCPWSARFAMVRVVRVFPT